MRNFFIVIITVAQLLLSCSVLGQVGGIVVSNIEKVSKQKQVPNSYFADVLVNEECSLEEDEGIEEYESTPLGCGFDAVFQHHQLCQQLYANFIKRKILKQNFLSNICSVPIIILLQQFRI